MYRSHIVGIILVIILGISTVTYNQYVYRTSDQLVQYIMQIEDSIAEKDWDTAQSKFANMQNEWKPIKLWWSMILDHSELDRIEVGFYRCIKYIENMDTTLSLGELATLKIIIENVANGQKLSWENIL